MFLMSIAVNHMAISFANISQQKIYLIDGGIKEASDGSEVTQG